MSRQKEQARPYWTVYHEFADAQKAYHEAAMMLYNAVDTCLSIYEKNPESAGRLLESLREHAKAYHFAAHREDG